MADKLKIPTKGKKRSDLIKEVTAKLGREPKDSDFSLKSVPPKKTPQQLSPPQKYPKSPKGITPKKISGFKLLTSVGGLSIRPIDDGGLYEPEGLTVKQFTKMLKTDKIFRKNLSSSSINMLVEKIKFYAKKLAEVKQEVKEMEDLTKRLKEKGVPPEELSSRIPIMATTIFMTDLENIIKKIEKMIMDTTPVSIAKRLLKVVKDTEVGLASIIGRDYIKNQFVSQIYAFSRNWKVFYQSFNNMALLGPAGSGKTQLAKVIANLFAASGILATNKVKIVSKQDLVGYYLGETGIKTKRVLMSSLEGVLVIDEAYQLTPCPESDKDPRDYGTESITEMVNFLDKYVGMNVVMVIGYKDIMTRCFFTNNEGLPRRFPFVYVLDNYKDSELTRILVKFIQTKSNIDIDQDTANFLFTIVHNILNSHPDAFKNQAGDMLNLGTSIVKSINFSTTREWKNGDLSHNIPLLVGGFNGFLRLKGLTLS